MGRYLLLIGVISDRMPKYSARQTFFWRAINCQKSKGKTRIIYSSENSLSETTPIAPSGMLDRAFVSKKKMKPQSASGLATASKAMLVGSPTYGPLIARNGLKRLSGYLDLHLCFY